MFYLTVSLSRMCIITATFCSGAGEERGGSSIHTSKSFRESAVRRYIRPDRTIGRKVHIAGRRVDEVVRAPANMKGGLVIIKTFCR